jgi:aerobic carbon-monoxide dehydrogenase medium subunit
MKLPPFEYASPETLNDAVQLLASRPGEAKVISGGQSLVPMLAFRLATPSLLVDLRKVPALSEIEVTDRGVRLGAMVRWCDIERHSQLALVHPPLVAGVSHVAHYQIRSRGTVGGSIAHADPAAELPGIAVTCEANICIQGLSGPRTVNANEFFTGALTNVLSEDEIVIAIEFPPWPAKRRWAFQEFARRRGDFAIAGVMLFFDEDSDGRARGAHIGVIGMGDRPERLRPAENVLNGRLVDAQTIALVANAAAKTVDPPTDIHATAEYRRALVATLIERALKASLNSQGVRAIADANSY